MYLPKPIQITLIILNTIIPLFLLLFLFIKYKNKNFTETFQLSQEIQSLTQQSQQPQQPQDSQTSTNESLKIRPELKYEFNPSNNGYFQLGSFLMQWGLAQGGTAGKNVKSRGQNPIMGWGMGLVIGITLDMMEEREAWDTGVSMNKNFDEIYGAQVIPYGDKDRTIYENIKIKELNPERIVVRTGNYHAPFFWFAYGLRIRNEDSDKKDNNSGISTDLSKYL